MSKQLADRQIKTIPNSNTKTVKKLKSESTAPDHLLNCNTVSQLEKTLRSRIASGDWPPGMKLPSERTLADEFSLSHSSVKRALGFLHRDGLLIGHQGKGHFVAGRPEHHSTQTIAVVIAHSSDSSSPPTMQALDDMRRVIHSHDYNLNLMAIRKVRQPPSHVSEIFDATPIIDVAAADAVIVMGLPESLAEPLYTLARHIPVCSTWLFLYGLGMSSVLVDYEIGTVKAITYLRELGHQHIAVYAPDNRNIAGYKQREGARIAKNIYTDLQIDCFELAEYLESEGIIAAEHWLQSTPRASAVFLGSDELTIGFISVIKEKDIKVPDDLSIITCNDTIAPDRFGLHFTTLIYDGHLHGRLAAQTVFDMLKYPSQIIETKHVSVDLIIRNSTTRIN